MTRYVPQAFDTGGALLHTRAAPAASPDAPRLVFVNSLGCDLRIWEGVAQLLSPEFDIRLYDKRGHGLSETGTPPYTMQDHADDLIALIEGTGGPATVCGLSIGGMIAMVAALDRPDLIAGLILCDTASRIGSAERYRAREDAIGAGGMDAFADDQMQRWFSPRFRRHRPGTVRLMRNMLTRQPVQGYLGSVAALRDTDLSDRVFAIDRPALCLAGAEDASTPPEKVRALSAAIPGARFAEIAGAGHLPCIEAPEAMAAQIAAFARGSS